MIGSTVPTGLQQDATVRGGDAAVAAVDSALALAAARQVFTAAEARLLLTGVAEGLDGTPQGARVTALVRDALEAIRESMLVDRSRLVNALLDVRLALRS